MYVTRALKSASHALIRLWRGQTGRGWHCWRGRRRPIACRLGLVTVSG